MFEQAGRRNTRATLLAAAGFPRDCHHANVRRVILPINPFSAILLQP